MIGVGDSVVKCLLGLQIRDLNYNNWPLSSYEEATVKYWGDIAEAKKKESDPEPETVDDYLQMTHNMTRKSDNE